MRRPSSCFNSTDRVLLTHIIAYTLLRRGNRLLGTETHMPSPSQTPSPAREMLERFYESGRCVQKDCATLGVHPTVRRREIQDDDEI
jgi:hypothetical protein